MKPKPATIGDISGKGMAMVNTDFRGLKTCTGSVVAADAMQLMMTKTAVVYSGILYDGNKESVMSFPVMVTRIQDNKIEFIAIGNPYESRT